MNYQTTYKKARKRAKAKVGFYIHVFIFCLVIALLTIINLTTNASYFWVKWPLMGWGIGLLFHGLGVFVFAGSNSLTEKMIERDMSNQGWDVDKKVQE